MKLSRIIAVTCFGVLFLPLLFVDAQQPNAHPLTQLMTKNRKIQSSSDVEERRRAAETYLALSREIHDAAPSLSSMLSDPDDEVRIKAAQALGGFGSAGRFAIGSLVRALETDKVPEVRMYAAHSLGGMLWEGSNPYYAKKVVPALIKALHDNDTLVRRRACYAFRLIGPLAKDAAPALLEVMKEKDDPIMRETACISFFEVIGPGSEKLIPALIEMIKKGLDDPEVERSVWVALRRMDHDDDSIVPFFIEIVKCNKRSEIRVASALVLGKLGRKAKSAVPHLVELLNVVAADKSNQGLQSQKSVLETIGSIGSEARSATPVVRRLAEDRSTRQDVRITAQAVLKLIER